MRWCPKDTFSFFDHQPSITGSNDSTSLDGRSFIAPFRSRDHDVDSHASLIPAPRSTTASITSSLDNVHAKSASSSNVCSSLPEVSCEGVSSIQRQNDDITSMTSPSSSNYNRSMHDNLSILSESNDIETTDNTR